MNRLESNSERDRRSESSRFDAPSDGASLKQRSLRSGGITIASQGITFAVHLGSIAILARILTPEDYGLVAMVTAITAFAGLFKDLGLSPATVQKKHLTADQLSTMFWINAALGVAIMLGLMALAPGVAWFYQKPELFAVTLALSTTFLISSLAAQQTALMTRQMRFGTLAVIQVTSMVATFTTSVIVALQGGGYWALVWGTVAGSAWRTAGLWAVARWRPGLPVKGSGVRQMIGFGAHITGFSIVNYAHRNLDHVLIGRVWGAEALGLYSRAYSLLMLPLANLRGPLNQVAFPAMSRLQDDPELYRRYFLKYCSILAFISMPLMMFLLVTSENVIRLMLGSQWVGAADIFAILAIAGLIQPVASLRGLVLMSGGRGARYFRWGLYNAIATVTAFVCGLPWGALGVASAYAIVTYLILHPSLVYVFRDTALKPADFYLAVARPFAASLVMCLTIITARILLPELGDFWTISICGAVALVSYPAALATLPGGRVALADYWANASLILRRQPGKSSPSGNEPAM